MRERQEKTIDNVTYALMPISVFKASKVFTKLVKVFGLPLLKVLAGSSNGKTKKKAETSFMDIDLNEIAEGAESLLERLSEDDFQYFCEQLLPRDYFFANNEKVISAEMQLNEHGLLHSFKVLKFAVEVNFKDFLAVAKDIRNPLAKK